MTVVGVTSLLADEKPLAALAGTLGRYGLRALGGHWKTSPEQVLQLDWRPMVDAFIAQRAALWLVLADANTLAQPAVRYGLNLMAASLRSALGDELPVAVLWRDAAGSDPSARPALPAQLTHALVLEAGDAWPAKVVARLHRKHAASAARRDRVSVHGNEQLGQWIELAPGEGSWPGLVFAVAGEGALIDFQATGPAGGLPERSVIAYGQSGLRIESAGKVFTGWALRNTVGRNDGDADSDAASRAASKAPPISYYARVRGRPEALLWMPYTEDDDAQATLLALD